MPPPQTDCIERRVYGEEAGGWSLDAHRRGWIALSDGFAEVWPEAGHSMHSAERRLHRVTGLGEGACRLVTGCTPGAQDCIARRICEVGELAAAPPTRNAQPRRRSATRRRPATRNRAAEARCAAATPIRNAEPRRAAATRTRDASRPTNPRASTHPAPDSPPRARRAAASG